METSTLPPDPTSTPSGREGSSTDCITWLLLRSITLRVELPLLVTYSQWLSIEIAAARGVVPTPMLPVTRRLSISKISTRLALLLTR